MRGWSADAFTHALMDRKRLVNTTWRCMAHRDLLITSTAACAAFGLDMPDPKMINGKAVTPGSAWLAFFALGNLTGALANRAADHGALSGRLGCDDVVGSCRFAFPTISATIGDALNRQRRTDLDPTRDRWPEPCSNAQRVLDKPNGCCCFNIFRSTLNRCPVRLCVGKRPSPMSLDRALTACACSRWWVRCYLKRAVRKRPACSTSSMVNSLIS
jgi:hypothetical protein